MLADCHQILIEVRSQVMALWLLQEGVDDRLKMLQKNKELDKSNLDLVRLLAAKTAQCEALAKKTWNQHRPKQTLLNHHNRKQNKENRKKYAYYRELHYT